MISRIALLCMCIMLAMSACSPTNQPAGNTPGVEILPSEAELTAVIKDPDSQKKLDSYYSAEAIDALIVALHDNDKAICEDAFKKLLLIPADRANYIGDDREKVIKALGGYENKSAVSALESALNDQDSNIAAAAACALAQLGNGSGTELLIEMSISNPEKYTTDAILALGALGTKRAKDALGAAMQMNMSPYLSTVIDALELIGDDSAATALFNAVLNASIRNEIRIQAFKALAGIDTKRAEDAKKAALKNSYDDLKEFLENSSDQVLAEKAAEAVERPKQTQVTPNPDAAGEVDNTLAPLPKNGEILLGQDIEGKISVAFHTYDSYFYIKIVRAGEIKKEIFLYPQSNNYVNLDVGIYEIKCAKGIKWYGPDQCFGPSTEYGLIRCSLDNTHRYVFDLNYWSDGVSFDGLTIINADEFKK